MNYPAQQPQYPQYPGQPAVQQPQQAYPTPMPQYPPQAPPQQAYPTQYGYPQQPQQQPAPPLAQGTLDDFYNQPSSGGGPSLKFEQVGTRYVGIVSRDLGQGDVQQQTDTQGRPLFFKDGRPKFVMKVPLQMQPTAQYPDGVGQWYVKGAARDELTRAMAEAGAPPGAPEAGAVLDITFVSTRQSGAGMNPAKVFQVRYTRPEGSQPHQQPDAQQAPQQPATQPVQQQAPVAEAPSPAPAAPQQYAPPAPQPGLQIQQQPGWSNQQGQVVTVDQAAAPQQQAPQPLPPSDLSPEQQALLARLTGGAGQ